MKKVILGLILCIGLTSAYAQKTVTKATKFLEDKNYAAAKEQIDLAIQDEKASSKPKTWFTRGQVYAAIATAEDESVRKLVENPLQKAMEAYEKAKSLEKNETAYYYVFSEQEIGNLWGNMVNEGAAAYDAGNYEQAMKAFDKAAMVKPQDTTAFLYAGIAAQQFGEMDKATEYFHQLINLDYKGKDIYNMLISYERDTKENYAKAQEVLEKAKERFPEDTDFKKQEVALLIKMDKVPEAKQKLEQAIASEPNNPELYFNLGFLNEELKDKKAAISAYKKALEVDPNHKNSAYNLAVIHYNAAADVVKEANSLGISRADIKKSDELNVKAKELFKEAVPYLEQALKLHPDNRTLTEITMVSYDRAGMKDKAKKLEQKLETMPKE